MKGNSPLATAGALPRIRLPSDLSGSLKHLDDGELEKLRDAVAAEIERRGQVPKRKEPNRPAASTQEARIPEGKMNLIHASFKAGLKPGAIARTLRMSPALVRRVLQSKEAG